MKTKSQSKAKCIAVASGKGGVGKSLSVIHMALCAAHEGKKVLIFDGDFGMANIDVILGLDSAYTIDDVLGDRKTLEQVIVKTQYGIDLIPSGSGIAHLSNLSLAQRVLLIDQIEEISDQYDYIFIDTAAGISPNVLHLCSCADALVAVTTPEPHAMTDVYGLIKVMAEDYSTTKVSLIVNRGISREQALKVFSRIADVSAKFLSVDVNLLGHIPDDEMLQHSIISGSISKSNVMQTHSGHAWNECLRQLSIVLEGCRGEGNWSRLLAKSPSFEGLKSII